MMLLMVMGVLGAMAAEPPAGRQGRASVECRVEKDGRLTACVLLSEQPRGVGVGDFALRLVKTYRVPPQDRRIRNGKIVVPLKFKMPG